MIESHRNDKRVDDYKSLTLGTNGYLKILPETKRSRRKKQATFIVASA